MIFSEADPGAGVQCTRTALTTSTFLTAAHGTQWSRNGFATVIPVESATIRGRQAHPYTTALIATISSAVTSAARSRPCTARSIRVITATTSHAQDSTMDP